MYLLTENMTKILVCSSFMYYSIIYPNFAEHNISGIDSVV